MKNFALTMIAILALGFLAGCAATLPAQLPEGFLVQPIARSDADAPFDAARNGALATVAQGTVELTDALGKSVSLGQTGATALSFSPAGDRLAVTLPEPNGTLLRILDRGGKLLGETRIHGKVTSIVWRSEKELLAGAVSIRRRSFGAQMTSHLFQWDGNAAPLATVLNDVTLRPQVGNLPDDLLYNQLIIAVSPYGDEIAYTTLKDPPLFAPYLKVLVRNIEAGTVSEVGQAPIGKGKVVYTPDGESLVIGDANDATHRVSLPEGKELESWSTPANNPAVSRSGRYLLLDGHLYQKGKEIASFPPESRGAFLADGSGLVVSYRGNLYLVSGLKDSAAPALPGDLERRLKVRRLRSQGLINDQEYRKQLEKKEPSR